MSDQRSPVEHPPVTDWATDFDHTDPAWARDPFPIWDDLRTACPVAHSDRYGGVWLPTRHQDVAAIAYDTERFTSRGVVVNHGRPLMPAPQGIAPPISSDPPFHQGARRTLLPAFSPQAIATLEPSTRAYCEELVEAIAARNSIEVDGAVDYAQHIPVRVIAHMLGFPESDADSFREWVQVKPGRDRSATRGADEEGPAPLPIPRGPGAGAHRPSA